MKHTVEELVAIPRGQLRAAEEYIRQFYATVPNDVLAATLDMSVDMVKRRARKMGLRKERLPKDANGRTLTPAAARAERRRIRREYPDADREGLQRLARDLGITLDQLKARAKRYGVSRRAPLKDK